MNYKQEYRIVAPVEEVFYNWVSKNEIGIDWFLFLAQSLGYRSVVLNQVKLGSRFSFELSQKILSKKMIPLYVVYPKDFLRYNQRKKDLDQGIQFSLKIQSDLDYYDLYQNLEEVVDYREQIHLLFEWSNNGNFLDCIRTVPHHWRQQVYLDFPPRYSFMDENYNYENAKKALKLKIGDEDFPTFCPVIVERSFALSPNISHFSIPRKMRSQEVQVSIICNSPTLIKKLGNLKQVKSFFPVMELVVVREVGAQTRVIPKLESLTTTMCWVHPKESAKPINASYLKNLGAITASGHYVVFIDDNCQEIPEALLMHLAMFKGEKNLHLEWAKGMTVYNRTSFLDCRGYDPIYTQSRYTLFALHYRYLKKHLSVNDLEEWLKSQTEIKPRSPEDYENTVLLTSSFPELSGHFLIQKVAKRSYANYKLTVVRHFYIYWFFKLLWSRLFTPYFPIQRINKKSKSRTSPMQRNGGLNGSRNQSLKSAPSRLLYKEHAKGNLWGLRPSSYSLYWWLKGKTFGQLWRLRPSSYHIYWLARRYSIGQLWRLRPSSYHIYWLARRNSIGQLWRLRPSSYHIYWWLKGKTLGQLWRLRPSSYKILWKIRHGFIKAVNTLAGQAWRLKPTTYKGYWKLRGYILRNSWRLKPSQVYYLLAPVTFPIRKVFYFVRYQLNKRVLGYINDHQK